MNKVLTWLDTSGVRVVGRVMLENGVPVLELTHGRIAVVGRREWIGIGSTVIANIRERPTS